MEKFIYDSQWPKKMHFYTAQSDKGSLVYEGKFVLSDLDIRQRIYWPICVTSSRAELYRH